MPRIPLHPGSLNARLPDSQCNSHAGTSNAFLEWPRRWTIPMTPELDSLCHATSTLISKSRNRCTCRFTLSSLDLLAPFGQAKKRAPALPPELQRSRSVTDYFTAGPVAESGPVPHAGRAPPPPLRPEDAHFFVRCKLELLMSSGEPPAQTQSRAAAFRCPTTP